MLNALLLTACGILLILSGFWGNSRFIKPYATLVAWCAPVGLIVTLTGIILLIIPDFFS